MRVTAVGREAMEEALEDMVALAIDRVELRVGVMEALVDLAQQISFTTWPGRGGGLTRRKWWS